MAVDALLSVCLSGFHGPAPRSPLHRFAVRLRHSRSTQVPSTRSRGLLNCRKDALRFRGLWEDDCFAHQG